MFFQYREITIVAKFNKTYGINDVEDNCKDYAC